MSTQHTPEPWPEFEKHGNPCRTNIGDLYAVRLSRDDYSRARACVNACAGIPTDVLETGSKLIHDFEKVKQQRDELLELLNSAAIALPVLRSMLEKAGLKAGATKAAEMQQWFADAIAKARGYPLCKYCGDTGDVHRLDGEWLGQCTECDAAKARGQQS